MDELEDLEAEEFFRDPFSSSVEEFDLDYEFDAPRYYDFTRPEEHDSEEEEAERWLDVAAGYPPSPLVLKMLWRPLVASGDTNPSSSAPTSSSVEDEDDGSESKSSNCKSDPGSKSKERPTVTPRSWSFMSPTASHLAKKQATERIQWERLLRRFPKDARSEGKSSRSSSTSGVPATKRQKLEAGFLRKTARLKHQALFPHKEIARVSSKESGRTKSTIPVQPNLATAIRAERHRLRTKSESENSAKPGIPHAETRPVNRKICKAPSMPIPRKATRQLPELQGPKLHRSKSSSEKENRALASLNAGFPPRDRQEQHEKTKSFKIKERKSSTERRVMDEPPVDAFSQLSLVSELRSNSKPPPKVSKEKAWNEANRDNEMKTTTKSRPQKHCQCTNEIIASLGDQMGNTRLGISAHIHTQSGIQVS